MYLGEMTTSLEYLVGESLRLIMENDWEYVGPRAATTNGRTVIAEFFQPGGIVANSMMNTGSPSAADGIAQIRALYNDVDSRLDLNTMDESTLSEWNMVKQEIDNVELNYIPGAKSKKVLLYLGIGLSVAVLIKKARKG